MRKPYKRVRPVDDADFYAAWALAHRFCQSCGIPQLQAYRLHWPGLSRHHIIKFKRSDEACNLLMLCQQCHDLAEMRAIRVDGVLLPRLTIGICLMIKKVREPEAWDPVRLEELFGRRLPDLEPIPDFAEESYRLWKPNPFRPFPGECDA